jgi:hypothetical protein
MVFVGAKFETETKWLYFPFGANVQLTDRLMMQAIYDSNHSHMLLTYLDGPVSYSLIVPRMRHIGFQVGYRF